jgi:hypothetical protein
VVVDTDPRSLDLVVLDVARRERAAIDMKPSGADIYRRVPAGGRLEYVKVAAVQVDEIASRNPISPLAVERSIGKRSFPIARRLTPDYPWQVPLAASPGNQT